MVCREEINSKRLAPNPEALDLSPPPLVPDSTEESCYTRHQWKLILQTETDRELEIFETGLQAKLGPPQAAAQILSRSPLYAHQGSQIKLHTVNQGREIGPALLYSRNQE